MTPDVLTEELNNDLQVVIAFLVYLAASMLDYFLTVSGLVGHQIVELNAIVRYFIEMFGIHMGVLFPKVGIAFTIILGTTVYLNREYKEKRTGVKPQYILYGGAFLTSVIGSSWLFQKYMFEVLA
jgi:hypothetical protein